MKKFQKTGLVLTTANASVMDVYSQLTTIGVIPNEQWLPSEWVDVK